MQTDDRVAGDKQMSEAEGAINQLSQQVAELSEYAESLKEWKQRYLRRETLKNRHTSKVSPRTTEVRVALALILSSD